MLILPIKKKWFDMILSGDKKEEYREIKPYYDSRFRIRNEDEARKLILLFRNGYRKNSPAIKCEVIISKGLGKTQWGAEPNKEYYVLKILSAEKVEDK